MRGEACFPVASYDGIPSPIMASRSGVRSSNGPRARPAAKETTVGQRPDKAPAHEPRPGDDLDRARDLGIDTCGRIAEFWGFTRTMGRAFGLLYLAPDPLTQVEIQRRLQISAGSASMTLAALIRWGVVHKVWVRGQRREHYRVETDFWKMISGVLNERERREISAAIELVHRGRGPGEGGAKNPPRRRSKCAGGFHRPIGWPGCTRFAAWAR